MRRAGPGNDGSITSRDDQASSGEVPSQSTVIATRRSEAGVEFTPPWRRIRGPLVAIGVVAAAYLLGRLFSSVPELTSVYLLVVVVIAAIDGSRSAVLAAVVLIAYVAYAESAPGHLFHFSRDGAFRFGIFVAAMFITAVVAGAASRRADRFRRELLTERQRLSEAIKSKSDFMNVAAHELRTPLTVIAGYVSMLQDETFGRLPDRFRPPINAMQRKAREIASLVDEMLLVARVQKGTAPTASQTVDLRDAVRKAVERSEPRVTLEQATLSYEVPSTTVAAEVDPDHLAHILDNLISNALTYTEGRPWVKITVTGGDAARVMVKDRGWGVPEEMRERIFERFVHRVNPESGSKSGKGLGLSVSRELAERYGGSLDLVRSDRGRGSLFVLRLPTVP